MKLRRRPTLGAEVSIASMLAVAFPLAAFLLVTATFAARTGLEMNLPVKPEPDPSVLRIWNAVQLHVFTDSAQLECTPVEANEVERRLRSSLEGHTDSLVVLVVEPEVSYARMIRFYDLLAELRQEGVLQEVRMPLQREREGYVQIFGIDPFLACVEPDLAPRACL